MDSRDDYLKKIESRDYVIGRLILGMIIWRRLNLGMLLLEDWFEGWLFRKIDSRDDYLKKIESRDFVIGRLTLGMIIWRKINLGMLLLENWF